MRHQRKRCGEKTRTRWRAAIGTAAGRRLGPAWWWTMYHRPSLLSNTLIASSADGSPSGAPRDPGCRAAQDPRCRCAVGRRGPGGAEKSARHGRTGRGRRPKSADARADADVVGVAPHRLHLRNIRKTGRRRRRPHWRIIRTSRPTRRHPELLRPALLFVGLGGRGDGVPGGPLARDPFDLQTCVVASASGPRSRARAWRGRGWSRS